MTIGTALWVAFAPVLLIAWALEYLEAKYGASLFDKHRVLDSSIGDIGSTFGKELTGAKRARRLLESSPWGFRRLPVAPLAFLVWTYRRRRWDDPVEVGYASLCTPEARGIVAARARVLVERFAREG